MLIHLHKPWTPTVGRKNATVGEIFDFDHKNAESLCKEAEGRGILSVVTADYLKTAIRAAKKKLPRGNPSVDTLLEILRAPVAEIEAVPEPAQPES